MPYYIAEIRIKKSSDLKKKEKVRKRLITYLTVLMLSFVVVFTQIIIAPSAVGQNQSEVIDSLRKLYDDVSELPNEAFEKPGPADGQRKALCNKINAVINQIESGAYKGALSKLRNDIENTIAEWVAQPWEGDLIEKVEAIIELIEEIIVPPGIRPVASFTFIPETPLAGEIVTFNASASYDPDGYIVSYTWDFGDNGITTVSDPIITHIYATYGIYTVKVTVKDNDGLTGTKSKPIKVIASPTASFTYSPLAPVVGEVVTFNASNSVPNGGEIVSYVWDFGDSLTGVGKVVTHVYDVKATYRVVLNVTDTEGLWDTDISDVTVYAVPPVVDSEPPIIVGVFRHPEEPNYDEDVTVMASVIDIGVGVENVTLSYSVNADWINLTMTLNETIGFYVAKIQSYPYNTTVNYQICAYDKAGNPADPWTDSYVVIDSYSPVISYVEHLPSSPNYNDTVSVVASVIEPQNASGVKLVKLSYRSDSTWTDVTMTLKDTLYTANIPALPYQTNIKYKVYAFDNADNQATSSVYSYVVGDQYPPIIEAPAWEPIEPFADEKVNVTVRASEPTGASGVKNVTLWYKTNEEWKFENMTLKNGNWTATIPGQSGDVTVELYIDAYDNAGNHAATTTYSYLVKAPPGIPLAWLAIIGLGIAALVATLLYYRFRKRKKKETSTVAAVPPSRPIRFYLCFPQTYLIDIKNVGTVAT